MENKNRPAFPQACAGNETGIYLASDANVRDSDYVTGISKREYAAIKIMSGLAADPNVNDAEKAAKTAVRFADALLAELEK